MSVNPVETGPLLFLSDETPPHEAAFDVVTAFAGPMTSGKRPLQSRSFLRLRLDQLERIGPHDGFRADGIVLAGCRGLADLQGADVALGVIEAEAELRAGGIAIIAEFGSFLAGLLANVSLTCGSSRLSGILLDEQALAAALGLPQSGARPASAPLILARGRTVLQAAEAGVPCFWSLPAGELDADVLSHLRDGALGDGFTDVAVRGTKQWQALAASRRIG